MTNQSLATIRTTLGGLSGLSGVALGRSPAVRVEQPEIDAFASATGDRQWIHVDPEQVKHAGRATTVAHGYLCLSLLGGLWAHLLEVVDCDEALNYGLDRVRFLRPVPAGSALEMTGKITRVDEVQTPYPGVRVYADVQLVFAGTSVPAVVAATILQFMSHAAAATTERER